jgi:hypothetical protein
LIEMVREAPLLGAHRLAGLCCSAGRRTCRLKPLLHPYFRSHILLYIRFGLIRSIQFYRGIIGMADILAFDHVNDIFRDILGVIADPLDRLGNP